MHRTLVKLLIAAFVLALPAIASAQLRSGGQIVGTVKDATGAVLPNAAIVLIDTATGATFEAKSGPDGNFIFPNLQSGTYTLTATATGFQPTTLQQILVQTARSTDVVVQFQVAGVTEQLNVEGRSPIVETSSTTVANTVSNAEIAKLPLAGRNILNFALLVPGTATSCRLARQRIQRAPRRRDQHHPRRREQQLAALPQRRHELLRVCADPARRGRGGHDLDGGPDRGSGRRRGRARPVHDQARL